MQRKISMFVLLMWCVLVNAQLTKVQYPSYSALWDSRLQIPTLVRYSLCPGDIGNVSREPSWRFRADLPTSVMWARHEDYNNSGYDRGHLCAAADRSANCVSMRQTFQMSNICPQVPAFNRGIWKKTEVMARHLASHFASVRIMVMPIFFDKDTTFIGHSQIAVPHAFLKVIYNTNPDTIYSHWLLWNK